MPLLDVVEPYLGSYRFIGLHLYPVEMDVPASTPLNFSWIGDASIYGSEIACYRYGWDIQDPDDPNQWETACEPGIISAPEKQFNSGIHTFFVEVKDDLGLTTRGWIQINIVLPD